MRRLGPSALLVLLASGLLGAGIIDRIIVTVGRQVITQSQLDEELRVAAFISRVPLDTSLAARRKAADRLVERSLVTREMSLSHYPLPKPGAVDDYRSEIMRQYGGEEAFRAALARYALADSVLRVHLAEQIIMLRFLDIRFRPEVDVTDRDIADAYHLYLQDWQRANTAPPPALEAIRETLRRRIFEERINGAFSRWIEERRKLVAVTYLDAQLR